VIENQKKRIKYGNKRKFYINIHLENGSGMEFTAYYG